MLKEFREAQLGGGEGGAGDNATSGSQANRPTSSYGTQTQPTPDARSQAAGSQAPHKSVQSGHDSKLGGDTTAEEEGPMLMPWEEFPDEIPAGDEHTQTVSV